MTNGWSEAIAVGSLAFVERFKNDLGVKAMHRELDQLGSGYALRERREAYSGKFPPENATLTPENTILWEINTETWGI